ncbi:MAG TPA: hypothetical protein VFQ91_18020 [Bryobacteraceae bacterium]|nr:hypothetical protein [Bryobacteraceae bacterium]
MRSLAATVLAATCLSGCLPVRPAEDQAGAEGRNERRKAQIPADMVRVEPARRAAGPPSGAPAAAELRIGSGRFFSYALPPGWRVGEDGQFALTLLAPDNKALTVMVGNAGLPPGYSPAQFVYEKLSALRPENLQIGQPRPAAPAQGFQRAFAFEVRYAIGGAPCRGIAKCHITTAYDTAVMAMTAALSEARQWESYAPWLPQVSEQIAATNGAAFGMRGIMAQNLRNSTAYAQAAREYRDWSQKNWQQVTDGRNASQDRRNAEFRENLGALQTYTNPYDARVPLELPTKHQYYWVDRQGNVLGTDNPGSDPNVGSTDEWKRMERVRR